MDLGRDLAKNREKHKNDESRALLKGFGGLGGAILVHLGAMFGQLGAILEQLGDKIGPKSAKMRQDSAQERQDETRWRKEAPGALSSWGARRSGGRQLSRCPP